MPAGAVSADDGIRLLPIKFLEMIEGLGIVADTLGGRPQRPCQLFQRPAGHKRPKNVPAFGIFVAIETQDLSFQGRHEGYYASRKDRRDVDLDP